MLALCAPTLPFGTGPMRRLRRLWCRGTCRLLGVRATLDGTPFRDCPTLLVANHVSYLDVVVLGSFVDATFVAKSEVAGWPLFGLLGQVTRTLFVKRHWRQALAQRDALADRMRAGLHPLRRGDKHQRPPGAAVQDQPAQRRRALDRRAPGRRATGGAGLRPIADGTPFSPENYDLYAWHSDAELVPHLWDVLRMEGVEVRLVLGEPVPSWSVRSRKLLGPELRDTVEARCGERRRPARARRRWCRRLVAPACGSRDRLEKGGHEASFSDRTCVCGLAPRYEPILTVAEAAPRLQIAENQSLRSTTIFLISAIAFAGLSPLGQVLAQLKIVWQR